MSSSSSRGIISRSKSEGEHRTGRVAGATSVAEVVFAEAALLIAAVNDGTFAETLQNTDAGLSSVYTRLLMTTKNITVCVCMRAV